MKSNIYITVFGALAVIVIIAGLSTFLFNQGSGSSRSISLANLQNYGAAPNIQGTAGWINSQPLSLSQLRGKVVLVDFWTYSCINCIRTIPHLNALYSQYGNNGLVIIGVHTPEFQFEKNYSNVLNAVQRFGIKYPVVLDSNYSTWTAYNNHYWPADYIIDKNGDIRAEQFGEGDYNQTEAIIRELLLAANYTLPSSNTNVSTGVNFSGIGSPEMYFGYQDISGHGSYFSSSDQFLPNQVVNYTISNITNPNTIYISGRWFDGQDSIVSVSESKIFLVYKARNVNVVASGNGQNTSISIKLDGSVPNQSCIGSDGKLLGGQEIVNISNSRLYNVVSCQSYGIHLLEIDANPNFRIYTFTFG